MDDKHYNQKPRRNAEFINVPNILKAKVGTGGLSDKVIERAQELLESHAEEFAPLADIYLSRMDDAIKDAKNNDITDSNLENKITNILLPCVQLKANGAMFNYPLVTRIANKFAQFMEVVDCLDAQVLDIASAFHATIKIIVTGGIKGDGGTQGEALAAELNNACLRYFDKNKDTISKE